MESSGAAAPSFGSEKTLPNEGSETPAWGCSTVEGATGMGLRAEQGLLSTSTGAWPSNTAASDLETDDPVEEDGGRDTLVMRLLTSESGLLDLGTAGTGDRRFFLERPVWFVTFSGLGLFPLGRGIRSRGISGITEAESSKVAEEFLS